MTHPSELQVQRYGAARPRRRALGIALATAFGLLLLGWAVWAGWGRGDGPGIDATVSSYDVVGTHETRVRILTHFRDSGTDGACLVRATAADHTVVGELNLTAAQLRSAGQAWIPIRTERRATAVEIVRCTDAH